MESSDVRVLKECPTLPPQYSVLEGCRSSLHNVEKGDRAFIGIPVPQHVDHTAHISDTWAYKINLFMRFEQGRVYTKSWSKEYFNFE